METKPNTPEEPTLGFYDTGEPWKLGNVCLTAVSKSADGKEDHVAVIMFDYDRKANAPIYTVHDAEGNELFEPSYNLTELKQKIMSQKSELIALRDARNEERGLDPLYAKPQPPPQLPAQDSLPSPYADKPFKKKSRARQLPSHGTKKKKTQSRSR